MKFPRLGIEFCCFTPFWGNYPWVCKTGIYYVKLPTIIPIWKSEVKKLQTYSKRSSWCKWPWPWQYKVIFDLDLEPKVIHLHDIIPTPHVHLYTNFGYNPLNEFWIIAFYPFLGVNSWGFLKWILMSLKNTLSNLLDTPEQLNYCKSVEDTQIQQIFACDLDLWPNLTPRSVLIWYFETPLDQPQMIPLSIFYCK